eukprot:c16644_g1_i1.p1 GENE.c16644_g1_i1~~c16644_g1_i1.p1  ORF type:complete len:323 (+),score=77.69 c16644_g1_i1:130-1098(+)
MFLLSSLSEEEGEEEEEEDDDEMEDKEGGDDAAIATDANEEDKREGGVSMQAATASDFGDAMSDEEGENMTLDQHIMHARALREKMRQQAAEDAEFPDEVDTPENVPARQRFARYRGLRSFRTSPWDPKENLPLHYSRTTAFENIKRATKRALAAHANSPTEVGMFVAIVTDPIPEEKTPDVLRGFQGGSLVVSGLLPNEHRIGVVHFRLQRHPDFEDPIRSKQLLLVHCGFRSFLASMIFSEDNPNHDKHKMDRLGLRAHHVPPRTRAGVRTPRRVTDAGPRGVLDQGRVDAAKFVLGAIRQSHHLHRSQVLRRAALVRHW